MINVNKPTFLKALLFLVLIFGIGFIWTISEKIKIQDLNFNMFLTIIISLICIFLGILLEWEKVTQLVNSKPAKRNKLYIPSLVLFFYAMFPWFLIYILGHRIGISMISLEKYLGWLIEPGPSRFIINLLTGVMIVRSFNGEKRTDY
ncbi:hypothetical protein KHA93_19695 [Bacillus sp. FJAT-49732]|uniref:Uncharacterized protein n=1 Tax=Lederbergia citrisecunda TaxID=2833583 RepID=A0A942TTC7_9BACI|nr:hypothetical protein [Lederbergia citrisecunda]MBS4201832.1 hypothetical protein [Lederbergia citrisecunda]